MSRTKFVTIASFLTPEPAYLVRARLDAEGIAAFLENESAVGMMGVLSNAVGGVKLQVEQADVERAVEILGLLDDKPHAGSKTPSGNWKCVNCGTKIESTFDVCWSCGASPDGTVDPSFQTDEDDAEKVDASPNTKDRASNAAPHLFERDPNPYASPKGRSRKARRAKRGEPKPETAEDETPDELALRAYRAAIFGFLFFMCVGALNWYSLYVLAKIGSPSKLSGPMKTRYAIALAIDLAFAVAWGWFFFSEFVSSI